MKIQDGSGEKSGELRTDIEALKAMVDIAERAMRPLCASAHDVFLLIIFELLRREALATRPKIWHLLMERFDATLTGQACFEALAGYLSECAGQGNRVITDIEAPIFRVVAAKLESVGAAVAYLAEATSWESPQEKLNLVKEAWKKVHTPQARLFRYRGYITKPGQRQLQLGR